VIKSNRKLLAKITPAFLVDFEYPDPTRVLGLSTSHWTDVVNWEVARDAGIRFAYIKAQNGINNPVRFWKENYEGAKKAGIKVGGYTWLYPPSVASPGTQARKFAEFAKDYETDLPWCVDFEWTSPSNPNSGDLWGFIKPYEDTTGKRPAIYTAPGYWNQYGSKNIMWADYPLWQAQYNKGFYDNVFPWKQHTFLQWTEKGKGVDYGVPTYGEIACELNYYSGTIEEFTAAYGDTPPIPPPPVVIPTPPLTGANVMKGIAKAITNIKPMAGGNAIAQLQVGGWVFGEKGTTDLMNFEHYYKPTGARVELGKPCKATLSNLILTNQVEDPPPPPPPPDPEPSTGAPKKVTVETDDGSIYVATQFTKL